MRKIVTSNGKETLVDDEDYECLINYNWTSYKSCYNSFIVITRIKTEIGWKTVRMHRLILGAKSGQHVDHVNHDTLDNRKSNLRICSPSDNLCNRKLFKSNTSGFKGVIFNKQHNKWMAKITKDGKQYFCGYFDNKIDASNAYDLKMVELFGEFSLTNKHLREREVNINLHTTDKATEET